MSASKGELSGTQRREAHCDERHITCSNGTFINRFPQRHANSTLSVKAADNRLTATHSPSGTPTAHLPWATLNG
ncbi:MAG: hypothetical protein ACRCVV_18015 [Shewanella sp.]